LLLLLLGSLPALLTLTHRDASSRRDIRHILTRQGGFEVYMGVERMIVADEEILLTILLQEFLEPTKLVFEGGGEGRVCCGLLQQLANLTYW